MNTFLHFQELNRMETRDPPSLLNRVITPPLTFLSGIFAVLWFAYRVIFLLQNISEPVILFDKGSYYMLGVGVALLSLSFVAIIEFWGGKPITSKQNIIFSRLAISGVALLFVVPHVAHFAVDKYLERSGYSVCEEASHQWLFVRDIVYVQASVVCSEDIESK